MERVVFTESWKSILAENGLKSFSDFYNYQDKSCINKNKRRDVSILCLKIGDEEKKFYLKRFHHPYFKDVLFTFLNTGKIYSQAAYEWSNINLLKKNNIETYSHVCFGERLGLGIEKKSFILTEELKGQCLTDFLAQNWSKLPQSEKEKIIVSIAQMVRRIHKVRISLPDLYVWHIFISENKNAKGESEYNLAVIDLHRMKRNIRGEDEKIKNLGRLHYSMIDKYFDKGMRKLLIEAYAFNETGSKFDHLARQVKKYAAKVSSIRKQKEY